MKKEQLKTIIRECINEVLNEPAEVFTIQEMTNHGMLNDVPEIQISNSEYNRLINESVEIESVEDLLWTT